MSARRCSVNDNIFVPFTGCRSRAQCSEGLDSFTPPPPSVEQGLITVLLSREGEGLAHDPMAREGLSPELGSVDPLRWTQNLSSLLLEEPTQTRGPGELWTLPSHCWGTAVSKCNRQGGNENRARKGRQTCR